MLTFHYQPDTAGAADDMTRQILEALQAGNHVCWLVCGGSSIAMAVACMQAIPAELTGQLTILLTDERYGVPGHADSNWTQLFAAGFDGKQATIIPTLTAGLTLEDTCQRYGQAAQAAIGQADYVIAQFGVGGDGHIAGILPHSPAVDSQQPAVGYDAGNFTRVTLTPTVLRRCTDAYAFVFGSNKRHALEQLRDGKLSLDDQPAQILKDIPNAYLYTDQLKEKTA